MGCALKTSPGRRLGGILTSYEQNRIGDKEQPWWSPTLPRNESDLLLAPCNPGEPPPTGFPKGCGRTFSPDPQNSGDIVLEQSSNSLACR